MSFRLRVLALIMFITVTATGVTAWLTLRQVAQQVRESAVAGRQEVAQVAEALRQYGLDHGTWDGVGTTVGVLAERTGQRVRVESDRGAVLADSDVLAGRPARAVVGAPILVHPRPEPRLTATGDANRSARLLIATIGRYRSGVEYAACLTRAGAPVTARTGPDGVPDYQSNPPVAGCTPGQRQDPEVAEDGRVALACSQRPAAELTRCLEEAFVARTAGVGAGPALVYLGAVDEPTPAPRIGPTVGVAVAVAAAGILSALLLSRRVLRPVNALTGAARRLGAGDLTQRVPTSGRDEIAELGRAFNRMAGSLQAAEARQQRLTSDIAHELRTPLANLRGYLEALRDGVVEPAPELLASLHEEVLLQQRIVDDLQDLALAEAGVLTYHRTDVDLAELVEGCRTAHRPLAERAGVALAADLVPVIVHADPDRLRQVVGNLLTNAVRATPAGGSVRLQVAGTDAGATIKVADTGVGIAAGDLPHLFDRFWRVDAARGRRTGGSGLGLAIVRQLVADHGGTVGVESTPGAGTTFTVTLPAGTPHG